MPYIDMDEMPGFRLTWNLSSSYNIEPDAKYSSDDTNELFVR